MAFPILGNPRPQFFDSSGSPLAAGTLAVLNPADDTNKASYPTYDDAEALTNANDNPILLVGDGRCALWGLDGEDYKLVVKDVFGDTIWNSDDVNLPLSSQNSIGLKTNPITTAETSAGVTPVNYNYKPGNILRYGDNDDPGVTNMTVAFNNAFSSNHVVTIAEGTYATGLWSIPSSLREVRGEGIPIIQVNADNTKLIDESGLDNLHIHGIHVKGFSGGTVNSNSRLIQFTNSSRIRVYGNVFEDSLDRAVMLYGCTGSSIHNNNLKNNTNGLCLDACQRCAIQDNLIDGSLAADATFKIGIFLAPYDTTYGFNEDIVISGNRVYNLANSQAIIAHSGKRLTIIGNTSNLCATGISLNKFSVADIFEDITITGNTLTGVGSSVAYSPVAEGGVQLAGTDVTFRDISVTGNTIRDFNNKNLSNNQGGISVIGVEDAVITSNSIRDCDGVGIGFSGQDSSNILVAHNNIRGISGGGGDAAIKVDSPTVVTGYIKDNWIESCARAYRFETAGMTDLVVNDSVDKNNTAVSDSVSSVIYNGVLVARGDTTPSVAYNVHTIQFNNAGATTVTTLDNGYSGQVITMIDPSANTTLSEDSDGGDDFKLSAGSDYVFTASTVIQVIYDGSKWQEVSRSVN